ncbi:MAG: DNA repair protein RecO [Phycisphaerales bacterium]|nr:MAG: DNA repair protein RecO [Phycisphaerales bacterium]
MPTIVDEAVVVRLWDFSETSQTASLFTREHGVLRGLAKGARRPHARFSGGMDLLTRGQVVAIVKPSAELATLTEWDLQEVFWAARRDLGSHYASLYFVDLIAHAITDHDPHRELYEALVDGLRALGKPQSDSDALPANRGDDTPEGASAAGEGVSLNAVRASVRVQWAVLVETGYRPVLDRDARTGAALPGAPVLGFSPVAGGVTSDPGQRDAGVWRVRPETIAVLRTLDGATAPGPTGGGATGDAPGATSARAWTGAARLLGAYLCEILGRRPPSYAPFVEYCLKIESPVSGG